MPAEGRRPYAPSWANLAIDWLERLPGPTWLAYAGAIAAGIALSVGATTLDPSAQGQGTFALVYYGALPFAALAVIGSLDRAAGRALRNLRPWLQLSDAEMADVHYRLTVAPARPAVIIALLSFAQTPLTYVLDPVGAGVAGYTPLALVFRWFWESLVTSILLVLIYHTFRQLRLISGIHDRLGAVDIFAQAPLYAMSAVTSGTAAGLILLLVPSLFLIPQGASETFVLLSIGWYGFVLVVAAAAFFLPLGGMHGRLVAEKERLQSEVGRRIAASLDAINAAVDRGDAGAIDTGMKSLAALTTERDLVNRIPTWPWSTAALTRFVSAVLLPMGLWLATRLLERVF
jgi:hypothetical protein